MTVVITGKYIGNKRTELTHEQSGAILVTDAPKDNQGEGRSFSPTDLLAASFGSCVMTVMAIVAERDGIDLSGMHMRVEKEMNHSPRRVARMPLQIHMPKKLTGDERVKLERTGTTCPVNYSMHPEVKLEISFIYDI